MPGLILFTKKARTILIVRAFRLTLGGGICYSFIICENILHVDRIRWTDFDIVYNKKKIRVAFRVALCCINSEKQAKSTYRMAKEKHRQTQCLSVFLGISV